MMKKRQLWNFRWGSGNRSISDINSMLILQWEIGLMRWTLLAFGISRWPFNCLTSSWQLFFYWCGSCKCPISDSKAATVNIIIWKWQLLIFRWSSWWFQKSCLKVIKLYYLNNCDPKIEMCLSICQPFFSSFLKQVKQLFSMIKRLCSACYKGLHFKSLFFFDRSSLTALFSKAKSRFPEQNE